MKQSAAVGGFVIEGAGPAFPRSLVKTFEDSLGPSFQNKTGYKYTEARGSIQSQIL